MLEEAEEKGITTWVEPFVGGGNIIDKVPPHFERIGIDINPHTIAALIAIRDYADELPEHISKEEYDKLKGTEPNPITSWLRFVASFRGMFETGYARGFRNGVPANHCAEGKRNAQKQSPKLQEVKLICGSYDEFSDFENCLIYCDPPYKGVASYKTQKFDHDKFWEWCRKMSKKNSVFVSEYNAPNDFKCVWQGKLSININKRTAKKKVVEKLFKFCGNK